MSRFYGDVKEVVGCFLKMVCGRDWCSRERKIKERK